MRIRRFALCWKGNPSFNRVEQIRRHLARAQKRKGFGWERWSRPWLYDTLKLFNSYRVKYDGSKVALA
jgi:RNA-directed DNA polymerase